MTRWISLIAIGALAAALLLLPSANIGKLAAIDAHTLLAIETPETTSGEGTRTHAAALLEAAEVGRTADEPATLRLGKVKVEALAGGAVGSSVERYARRSIVRALREQAGGTPVNIQGERVALPEGSGAIEFTLSFGEDRILLAYEATPGARTEIEKAWNPPRPTSILPPLVAILLAILLRRPVIALFIGVLAAATLLTLNGAFFPALAGGLGGVFTDFLWPELVDPGRQMIIGFVVFMLAMVGVLTKSGGIRGLMDAVARHAHNARSTQIATYLIGLLIFFDDYANTILCGSTMRPLSDRFRIAREKLAYIVDSTAAPVAGLSVLSTWIAFEVSTFSAQLPAANLLSSQGYQVFIESLPYRFYCVFTLAFVGMVVFTGRDFGPMRAAEQRARSTGQVVRPGGQPLVGDQATALQPAEGVRPSALAGLVPILVFLGGTLFEILRTGGAFELSAGEFFSLQGFTGVLGNSAITWSIFLGSFSGFAVATLFALAAGLRMEILSASFTTLRSMGVAILILYLAWMLGRACGELGTAPFLTALLGDRLNPAILPAVLFVLASVVAFSTGSSWSTMTILLPLVVGLSYGLGDESRFLGENSGHLLLLMSIGAVLEGSIFGDHCSPISDTTVLSSVACASDHVDHVRTQAPYAILTMLVALTMGYLPCTFLGWSPWVSMVLGLVVLYVLLRFLGSRPNAEPGLAPGAEPKPQTTLFS